MNPSIAERIRDRLAKLYPDCAEETFSCLSDLLDQYRSRLPSAAPRNWDERDVVLITYGDQVRAEGEAPLQTLDRFLRQHQFDRVINAVHLLPFFPYSSDDGFSVIDYRQVDPNLGSWQDVRQLAGRFQLMFDLVLNHVSSQSDWFKNYLAGQQPYVNYFIEADPQADLSQVTRPRSSPLLTPVQTAGGERHVWTTFSADQIDLNFSQPAVLLEMVDVLLGYIEHGARIVRLDAIAYLWKEVGTRCIHLPQTHLVVKLLRDVIDDVAPQTALLTETNVPHAENVSYFGDGDEAHMVYQFSLAPLLLDALLNEDCRPLATWLAQLESLPRGCCFFNFTASHDGVGVRPLEGLVPRERLARLVDAVARRGGRVSTRRDSGGNDTPYELNITYFSALGEPTGLSPQMHARRFLTSQAVMLALRGVPGIYFHSLIGTPNDLAGVEASGHARRINRRKFQLDEVNEIVSADDSAQQLVFNGYRKLLAARISHPAFHPAAAQQVFPTKDPATLLLRRTSIDQKRHVVVAVNFSHQPRQIDLGDALKAGNVYDLLSDTPPNRQGGRLQLKPYQVAWLTE